MSGQKGEWRIFSLSNDLQVSWNPRKGEKLFKFYFYRGRCLYWGLFECLNRRFPIRFTSENVLPQMIRLKETIALIKAVFSLQFLVLNLFFRTKFEGATNCFYTIDATEINPCSNKEQLKEKCLQQ